MSAEPGRAAGERAVGGRAERAEQAGTAVVGAAAAEPDDDPGRARVDRGEDQLADAERRRGLGVLGAR